MTGQVVNYVFLLFSVWLWVLPCHSYTDQYTMPGDSLKPGDILTHTTQLCSKANTFCLYFEQIGSDFTYLQIRNRSQIEIVWIANRNEPVVSNSGVLTLDRSGELKIASQGKPIKTLYSPIQPINNSKAILLDNGNFVLQELHLNGSNTILWQSFDYPIDVLLPEMKLGANHKTGRIWSLVSWTNDFNPTPGDFTLEWEPINGELVFRVRGLVFWRSGSYRNKIPFQNMSEKIQSLYDFTIVSNEEEDSFTFTPRNKSNGRIPQYWWVLRSQGNIGDGLSGDSIARPDKCYGFNDDGGCQIVNNTSTCRSPIGNVVESVFVHINFTDKRILEYVKNDTNSGLKRFDCAQRCWSICECVGFYTIYPNDTGCTFLYRKALDVITLTIHPDENFSATYMLNGPLHHQGKKKWIWRSVVIATSLLIICLFILCISLRNRKFRLEEGNLLDLQAANESTSADDLQAEINKERVLRTFSYESIMKATNNFSLENKLGQGGFGPVYKGILPMDNEIAIKRLSKVSGQGVVEFKNELTLICELQHMNLVQLLGCCIYEEEKMLIYEYMPNKSLDFFLFDSTQGKMLDWHKRFNIIEGVAQGLLYLHQYSRLKVIHRDLKASNILLDENMNPKISDFGMARIFTQQESKVNTNRIVGTYGYMSPEYAMEGIFSTKSDIYSFGVLLLEIVSGRKNSSFYRDDSINGPLNLVGHAWDLWKNGAAIQLMDPTLRDSGAYDEILRCIHIGILCCEENADDRPTMSHIVLMLVNKSGTLSLPKRPATLFIRRNMLEGRTSTKDQSNVSSVNEVSLSVLDAR